ncbi:putative GTP-binding protein [Diplonema papillatum]|nr:putative GTP-binding protein [Diplonema papillatum]
MTDGQPIIMCLHGSHQLAEIFDQRLKQLQKKLSGVARLVFAEGACEMVKAEGDAVCLRQWWPDAEPKGRHGSRKDAVGRVAAAIGEQAGGPVVGLLGFSQGAALAALVLKHPDRPKSLLFGLLAGGCADDGDFRDAGCADFSGPHPSDLPTLSFAGKTDPLVHPSLSRDLSNRFQNARFEKHDAGHVFPQNAAACAVVRSFVSAHLPKPALSEDALAEFAALADIYQPDEFSFRPDLQSFAFRYTLPPEKLPEKDRDRRKPYVGELVGVIKAGYPDEPLDVRIEEVSGECGWMKRSDWVKDVEAAVAEAVEESLGGPVGYAACECFKREMEEKADARGGSKAAGKEEDPAAPPGNRMARLLESETDEARLENARAASDAIRSEVTLEDADWATAWGKGGRWKYTLGLVGKPSAGKSTLFNGATGDATAARVASFPFTTIEPNTADTHCGVPCLCSKIPGGVAACGAQLGHAADGQRFLRCTVRDVAGLVPGAYQGRGKGNKFLNDLNDADVLIHVVDASGLTDANGEETEASVPEQVREEVLWVRREIHQWMYTNVSRKWPALCRKPQALPIMFTGYHSTESMVHLAARKAGITAAELEKLDSWEPFTLHRLVAAFIRVRFPVVVALNKCDVPSAAANVEYLRREFPNECLVTLSAGIETQLLLLRDAGKIQYTTGAAPVGDLPDDVRRFLEQNGGESGVTRAMSAALTLRPSIRVFPVTSPTLESYGGILKHCFHLSPGSTPYDLYRVLSHDHLVEGDFVRSAVVNLETHQESIIKKDQPIPQDAAVHIMTNRKSKWQQQYQNHS